MPQIKCPNCGEVFTIDESNYNSIVKQIRDHEFNEAVDQQRKLLADKMNADVRLMQSKAKEEYEKELAQKNQELEDLKHEKDLLKSKYDASLAKELSKLEIDHGKEKSNAEENIRSLRTQVEILEGKLSSADRDRESAVEQLKLVKENEAARQKADLQKQIMELESKLKEQEQLSILSLENKETEKELAVQKAVSELKEENTKEVTEYLSQIETLRSEAQMKEQSLREQFTQIIQSKDQEIENQKELVKQYRDFKARQSTKMTGESLEQHCAYEFNRYRMGMFPNAHFEKDNDIRTGSKGDFIFRDYDSDHTEIISIMFEMKNERDTTATKHKNEDFFKELDKDRNEKGCEYAVLVTMLEMDNDLYNEGIVDVSYRYPKMYVIRPQFFISIITILRNAALNAVQYKKALAIERNNNLDITHFEENMEEFKSKFGRNYELASKKFKDAIDSIDKTIKDLEKTRAALVSSENNLRLANDKAQDLSIKKLTKNAPSVLEKFEEIRKNNSN